LIASCVLWVGCGEPAPKVVSTPPTVALSPPPANSSGPAPDWAAELEWARSRFPELASFRAEVDLKPLFSWVPPGKPLGLFITIADDRYPYRCAPVTASRPDETEHIDFRITGPEEVENGQKLRRYVDADVHPDFDGRLVIGAESGMQKQNKDGSWEVLQSFGTREDELDLSVGQVEGDALRFRHVPVWLKGSCGPVASLACDSGGSLRCNTCKEIKLTVTRPSGGGWHTITPAPIRNTCAHPCPPVTNPEFDRLTRFLEHFGHGHGFVLDEGPGDIGFYRTLSSCQADKLGTAK
jgi:hypothetical protein